jgi:hypothetical protein
VFIACFSEASLARAKSYQNEELILAIEQLRLRPQHDLWFIPVRLNECEIPDLDIGGGRTLGHFHSADLFGERSGRDTARLIATVSRIIRRLDGKGELRKRKPNVGCLAWSRYVTNEPALVLNSRPENRSRLPNLRTSSDKRRKFPGRTDRRISRDGSGQRMSQYVITLW